MNPKRKSGKTFGRSKKEAVAKFYTSNAIGGYSFQPRIPSKDFISDRMNPKPAMPMNPYPNY